MIGQTLGAVITTAILFLILWGGTRIIGRRFRAPRRKAFELALFVFALIVVAVFLQLRLTKPPEPLVEQTRRDDVPPTAELGSSGPSIPITQPEEAADPVSGQAAIGDAYFQQRAYKQAAQHYLHAAVCGDVHSQAKLSSMFRDGLGVEADPERAFLWLRIAYAMGRTDDSTAAQMMQQMDLLGPEAVEKMAGFGDLWEVRRPDETVSCMTAAQTAEPIFRAYPFDLD